MIRVFRPLVSRMRKAAPGPPADPAVARQWVARWYLSGQGIEVGALHNPLKVPAEIKVRYVDRMPVPELLKHGAAVFCITRCHFKIIPSFFIPRLCDRML